MNPHVCCWLEQNENNTSCINGIKAQEATEMKTQIIIKKFKGPPGKQESTVSNYQIMM